MVHNFVAFVYSLMYIHADLSFCSSPFHICWRDAPAPMALQNGQSESFPLKTNPNHQNHAPKQWNQSVSPTKIPFKKATATKAKGVPRPMNPTPSRK